MRGETFALPSADDPGRLLALYGSSGERRLKARYPVATAARYRVLERKDTRRTVDGTIVNISSSGLLLKTESGPVEGSRVQISMNWPAVLDGRIPLKLVIVGRVLRSDSGSAAVQIETYEFRTSRVRPLRET
jgi:hypothetical protein